jgi:hypothetical protein
MLKPDEIAVLAPEAIALGGDLMSAFRKTSDGGKKMTKTERRKIVKRLLRLAGRLGIDIID